MKLSKALHRGDAGRLYALRDSLKKPVLFKDLPNGAFFTVGKAPDVYKKIGNSHSCHTTTNVDAIFTLGARVHRTAKP